MEAESFCMGGKVITLYQTINDAKNTYVYIIDW